MQESQSSQIKVPCGVLQIRFDISEKMAYVGVLQQRVQKTVMTYCVLPHELRKKKKKKPLDRQHPPI